MYKCRLLAGKIALSLALSGIFLTNQAFAAEEPNFQLDQVTVTATRLSQAIADVPNDVTVITAEQIRQKGAKTLTEALQGVAGVQVKNYGGQGEKSILYILGSEKVIVLVDGKRMNIPQGIAAGDSGIDLNTIVLTDNIERIEVVRGGGSALYGSDAVGGVINIITKKGSGQTQTAITSGFGNYNTRRYVFHNQGADGTTRWFIAATQESTDGQRVNSVYKGKDIALRLDKEFGNNENLSFSYNVYESHAGIPGSVLYPSSSDYGDILRRTWGVTYSRQREAGERAIRFYENSYIYSGENWGSFRNQNTIRGLDYQDSAKVANNHVLTWGSEWRQDEVVSTVEGGNPHSGTTTAVYVQDQYSLNSRTVLTTGLRHDDNSIYGDNFLPKVSLLYKGNDRASYFANWGKIFKTPKFDDLYGDDGFGNTGNPNLKPETGWTSEVGVKSRIGKASEATLTLFKREITNAIKWLPEDQNDPWSAYHPVNVDCYTSTGVNASFITQLAKNIKADIGYTYLDGKDQNNASLGDPRHTYHIGLNFEYGKFSQSIYGNYLDDRGIGSNRLPDCFIVNTTVNYALHKDTAVFLTVNNLLDKKYEAFKGWPAQERTVFLGLKQSL